MVRETRHLWVANLPDNAREDRIKEHFQRYGRVQSVKIFISPGTPKTTTAVPTSQFSPSGGTITSTSEINLTGKILNNSSLADQHNLSSTITSNKCNSQLPTAVSATSNTNIGSTNLLEPIVGVNSCSVSNNNVTSSNQNCITMCAATIAFVDIKSASKAHLAEHKFDDRLLTTEYYEPSAMLHGSIESGGSSLNSSKMMSEGSTPLTTVCGEKELSRHERFSTNTTTNHGHGSTDDHSPGRTNFYDRVSTSQSGNRNSETSTDFIRRNNYHSNEIRGRQRDRHFRNNPYSLIVDRSNPISHHRLTTNTWYETSPSSSNSRNHFNSTNSNNNAYQQNQQQQQPDSSYDRQNSIDTTEVTTSNNKDTKGFLSTQQQQTQALINSEQPASYKSKSLLNHHHNPHNHQHHHLKVIKSRSGSESPISGRSSRSHSRSPSSCSSTHSHTPPTSSHSSSSPTSGVVGDIVTHSTPSSHPNHHHHHRHNRNNSTSKSITGAATPTRHRRNLQTSLSSVAPSPSGVVELKPTTTTISSTLSSSSSGGSVSGSNPVVHSEDNRPLAVCVKNLPLRSSDTSLKDGLFHEYKKHGKVTWVKVVGQNHERYALVCFKKPEDVEKALEVSQDKLFFGSKIEVEPYQGYDVDDNEFRPYEAEIDEYQSKSTRTLFIGNLEKNITVADLRKAFEQFGEILEIDIKKQGSSPYAFCQYADIVSVVKAVRKMDGEHFGTTRIKLGFGKSMPTSCVWLDGIVDSVSEHFLSQHFSRFGNVQKVAIDRDRKMALVSFDQVQSAQSAVKETRGTSIRGRKLQVDYASRECVEAFYARLEKFGVQSNINVDSLVTSGNNNMLRHSFTSQTSRSRASSFSRPGNPVSGTASPTSTPSAGSTPRHHSSAGSLNKKHRYTPEYFDTNEYIDYGEMERNVVVEPDNFNDGETIISSSGRRRCDKSPGDIRQVQRVDSESGNSGISSSNRLRRCDRSPGEMRILESQRHKLLDELEQCPSSGDEKESPKKRARFTFETEEDRQSHHNYHESSATNCNGKVLDHRDSTPSLAYPAHNHHRFHHEMIHRKTVEIRRLSDCNIKHSASVPGGAMTSSINHSKNTRRPSTDSLSRFQMDSYLQKRRKTSATNSTSSTSSSLNFNDENHASKGRGHPLHSNHSFEASGGESEHGSRPGTPLCDERPDDPMDPRRIPSTIINRQLEPMSLPLPKFAQHFHQQLRLNNQLLPASTVDKVESNFSQQQSSLTSNRSLSPSTQTPQSRSRSNSLMPPASRRSSTSETVTSPLQPSLSNSSDSEQELGSLSGPGSSPSLEERLKKFTEDYDSWSSNGRSSSSSHYVNNYRHSVPEISVPETPVLLKMVAKNSMFDEDSKRLESVNDKYTAPVSSTVTSKNAFGSFSGNPLTLSPMLTSENNTIPNSIVNKIQQPVTITTMIHQRLGSSGTGSPLNSPNTASPYNSPNPSSASSISSVKGLQYPFPSHPTGLTNAASTVATTSTVTTVTNSVQKPKTTTSQAPVLGKSLSLPETQTTPSSANNNNLSNLNVSCNKSSTNNHKDNMHSVNVVSTMENSSKLLMKSVSAPSESVSSEVVVKDEKKSDQNDEVVPSKDVENLEKKKEKRDEKKKSSREPEIESKKSEEKKSKKKRDENHHSSCSSDDKKEEERERAPSPMPEPRKRCVSFEDVSSVDSANEHTSKDISKSRHHSSNHNNHKKSSKDKSSSHDDEGHSKTKDSIFDELKRNTKDNIIKSEKTHKSKKHHHHSHRENNSKDKENQTHNDTSAAEEFGRSSDDESKHHPKHHQQHESSEDSSGKKKTPRRSLNNSLTSDDSDDSQGNKKASFFDIPDDSPNISMYDKVKARSCKNLKKQEEEKKIKDKFTALKQSRAKREQNRLKTSDDDSDSDVNDNGSHEMFKFKSQMSASEDDDKIQQMKNHLSVCDDESSDGGITELKRNKIANRKMSRTNVIDSSDDEMPTDSIKSTEDKPDVKQEDFNEFDELKRNDEKSHKNSKKRHHEKSKEDKPNKKTKKLSNHRKSSEKRDDKMEEIFGPISDDDMKSESVANLDIKKEMDDKEHQKEESRKRKEKRRREREKQRAMKEEENSVDFDEAGRALEAQLLMSDSEQQQKNNNEPKSDDVFRFTDGDDEMKRDHHDNSLKKKKKKKRAKEDRKHHHNHHHYDANQIKEEPIDNAIESSFNNNNNNKIRLDVIKDDVKPSVPLLINEIPTTPQPIVTTTVNQVQVKKEVKVPGFGEVVDAKIHEKAVLSIAQELVEKKTEVVESNDAASKLEADKIEEKSRVNISQEETEDAVAALLGESFSMSVEDEYLDPYDVPIVAETETEAATQNVIAPEEDEEMKNAIMSLNSEIDPKPDTPQSEHDLQIDTDNDEQQEEEAETSATYDNPPKTPDVDMAQLEKEKKDRTPERPIKKLDLSNKSSDSKVDLANIPLTPKIESQKESPQKSEDKKDSLSTYQSRFIVPPSITIPTDTDQQLLSPSKSKQPSPIVSKSVQSPSSSKVLLSPRTAETTKSSFIQPPQGAKEQPTQIVKSTTVEKKKPEIKGTPSKLSPPPQTIPMPPQIIFQPKTDDAKDVAEQQWQVNTSSVIQKAEPAKEEIKKVEETSHDEEDDENDKKSRGKQQRGRKTVTNDDKNKPVATASKRGRGGRGAKNAAILSGRQQKTSESDVYEFHDDSGEDSLKSAERPRLIVTIKSTVASPTTSSVPVTTSPVTPFNVVQSTQVLPTAAPSIQELPHDDQQVPSPAHSDDFAQPNNTRKSRRLLEKDGTRTSVDDTIDDVIRNVAPPAQSAQNSVQGSQQQQQNNRRTTRQTQSTPVAAAVSVSSPQPTPQQLPQAPSTVVITSTATIPTEVKKPLRGAPVKKIGKDRKVSETSESSEIKIEVPQVKVESQQNPTIPSQVIVSQIPIKTSESSAQQPSIIQVKKESSELLQLIDPVTGELQKMTQSKEGQYVPVAENRGASIHHLPPASLSVKQFPQFTIELKNEDKKPIVNSAPTSIPATIVKVPTIIEQPIKVSEQQNSHVVKPVIQQNPTYSKPPQPLKTYVLSSQNLTKNPVVTTPTSAITQPPVVTSQGIMKVNQQIVNHPSTIYNLPNIIPPPGSKMLPQHQQLPTPNHQKTIVLPQHPNQTSTIVHQGSVPPQIMHQKLPTTSPQILIHSQQQPGNLMINIPPSSSQGMPSPRMHQVKQQVIQRPMSQQQQQASPTTVVMKAGPPMHPHDPKMTKMIPEPQGYTMSGGREIIYVGGNIQKQTIYPNYHSAARTMPTVGQKSQQIAQPIPHSPKIVGSQPSVSVTQIQMNLPPQQHPQQPPPSQSQKVYFTNSGQVITSAPSSQSQEPNERHQQWIPPHEKISSQPQPLKQRYVMMENFEDARIQAERAQHQPALKRSYVIENPSSHQAPSQPIMPPQNKTVIGLNQQPQIMTGAVASPPLKAHLSSQQPIVTGASSSRISIPTMSPKDQHHAARHYPEVYDEAVMHGDRSAYRSQSPPPAHQTSPLTTRPPYMMTTKIYPHPSSSIYVGREYARLPSRHETRELAEDEQRPGSPPLELRRTAAMPLQSPSDRITDSPMIAPLYLSPRIPQPYYYEGERERSLPSDPPPAHARAPVYSSQPSALPPPTNLSQIQREREHREKEEIVAGHKEDGNLRYQIVYPSQQGVPPQSLIAPASNIRPIQLTTPPIASQVPLHADTLSRLLERYPLMWQGLLALKTEQAAVQMHFVYGNKKIAKASLPFNSDHTTPPLRIAQRMRLEPSQIEGVARKMQITDEHCVLLALPCGFDYGDVLRQTENLQVSFINYLQQKQAAGIINIADPGSQNPNYVVHIFPSCDFANDSLEKIAPDLMYKVANISHLLIVIATV